MMRAWGNRDDTVVIDEPFYAYYLQASDKQHPGADEVIVTNSTTVNLHQLLATMFEPRGPRNRILGDALSFPSDSYAIQSFLRVVSP
jgi:hypothetical protein